jgi:hypothetical protein
MSRHPLLALPAVAATLSALLTGCEYAKPAPAQLDALITLDPKAGGQSDKVHLRDLAGNIAGYLAIAGIDSKNARVRFDETKKTYHFEVFGKQPIPQALLEQVAKGLNASEKDRSWPAKVEVLPWPHLDTLLGGKERNFTVRANWKDANIDAYVIRPPRLGYLPSADPRGAKKTALCMLSFKPEPPLPKLEGTVEQFYGKELENDRFAVLRRTVGPDHVFTAPHEVTFDEPELAQAFKEAPIAKDDKLMFQFAVLEDVNILDFADSKSPAMDLDGATQKKCEAELNQKYPALVKIMRRAAMLSQVKAIGPARMIALPLQSKSGA